MAQDDWFNQGTVTLSAPAALPPAAPGVIYGRPKAPPSAPSAYQQGRDATADARASRDQQIQEDKARREQLEWSATHNPDGSLRPKPEAGDKNAPYSQSALDAFDRAINTANRLKTHPGFAAGVGMPSINPFDGNLAGFIVPGSPAADFRSELDVMKAQVFLPMVQSMKGMGALSNAEGQKLTDAIGNLSTSQSEGQFQRSLDLIIGDLTAYRDRGKTEPKRDESGAVPNSTRAGEPPAGGGNPGVPSPSGPRGIPVFGDEIPEEAAFRLSSDGEKALGEFVTQNQGNKALTFDQLNAFASSIGAPTYSPDDPKARQFLENIQNGQVDTSAIDYSSVDNAFQKRVDALAKERDTLGGEADAFIRGAADTVSLGSADKVSAVISTVLNGGTYKGNLAQERLLNAADNKSNPWARLGGQFAGAVALPMGASRTLPALALKGAGYGAGYSALSSDSDLPGRIGETVAGGALGALGGSAGYAVAKLGPAAANALKARAVASEAGREVADNANVLAAAERWDIPMRQPDIRPSTRADFAAAEASTGGNALITQALEADKALMGDALAHVGGKGASRDQFAIGEAAQRAGKDYIARTRNQANALYSRAEKLSGEAKAVPVQAKQVLADNIAELSQNGANTNAGAIRYLEDLLADIGEGPVSIQKLRSLRTNMRGQISERNLTATDTERRVMQVLDAAGKDIEGSLTGEALAAYKSADNFFREKQDFIKQVVQTFTGTRNAPLSAEAAGSRLMAMTKKGGDSAKFSRMWKELDPAERGDVQATIAESLGQGRTGQFSLNALASSLDKSNPRTLREVFGSDGYEALKDLQVIAKAKAATEGALNKSRTAVVNARQNRFKDIVLGVLGGGAGGVPGAIAGMTARGAVENFASRRTAKLLLNPDFTKWLRNIPASTDPAVINRHFQRLDKIAQRTPSIRGDAQALQQYLVEAFSQSPGRAAASEQEDQ